MAELGKKTALDLGKVGVKDNGTASINEIVEQFKKDYKSGLSVNLDFFVERHGFLGDKIFDAVEIIADWLVAERDKREREFDIITRNLLR